MEFTYNVHDWLCHEFMKEGICKSKYSDEVLDFHFFVRDHQGSVTAVIGRESAEQLTRYYPFGGLMTQDCMGEGVSADKYTGKRLDRMHGLDWYDFGARQYDPVYGRFAGIDPLCEKYPHLSPYAYCGNDPVNFVDPDGREYFVIINEINKTITITANYYAMSEDMDALNHALSIWNGLSYEIDGYKVGFDLKAMEFPDNIFIERAKTTSDSTKKERYFKAFLQMENTQDVDRIAQEEKSEDYMRWNNIFYIGTADDPNENGHTTNQIIKISAGLENTLTSAHEVGHTLGFIHDEQGLMTPDSSNPNRSGFISVNQVRVVINNAKNHHRYKTGEVGGVGSGYIRYINK